MDRPQTIRVDIFLSLAIEAQRHNACSAKEDTAEADLAEDYSVGPRAVPPCVRIEREVSRRLIAD